MPTAPRRPARLKDVAALAGVSQGLVSRLLNGDPTLTIRDETRDAVMAAVRDLDYVPNSSASALRRSRTDTVGLGLEHITNPLFRDIVHGAQAAAAEHDTALLLIDVEELTSSPAPFDKLIKARRIDGLMLQGGYSVSDLTSTYAPQIPTVIVNSPGTKAASGVTLEDEAATLIATKHLLALGHRRIGFVGGAPGPATDARYRGFERGLAAAGITPDPRWRITAGWEGRDGVKAMRHHLEGAPRITAYVVASAVAGMGVMHELNEVGLSIPGDISLVTVHDPWFAELLNPPLTTVSLPLFDLGYTSLHTLMDQIAGADPREVRISDPAPVLIQRRSTAPPRTAGT